MKKTITLISLLLTFSFLVAACGSSAPPAPTGSPGQNGNGNQGQDASDGPLIYGIYKAGDQVWFIDEAAASQRAVEARGGTFIKIDANMDHEENMNAIETAIANNADGVLICIVDQQMSEAVVDRLREADIPVVAVDDALEDANGNKLAPWVGIDAYRIGYATGEWMADYALATGMAEDPNVGLLLITIDTVSSVVPRTEGQIDAFTSRIPNFPEDRIFRGDHDGATNTANDVANTIFLANPEITSWIVMAGNDEGAVGALRALEASPHLDELYSAVMGLGAYLAEDEWDLMGEGTAMVAAAWFSAEAVGTISANMLLDYILDGTPMTMEQAVPAIIVTPQDYREIMRGETAESGEEE